MAVDSSSFLLSLIGGICMGSYPVPIKAPSVLAAGVHPIIFQCYKSFWVFVVGWCFVLVNMFQGKHPAYVFTWWGIASSAAWIPSGLFTIASVPRLGVGMAVILNTSTASLLSFLVFWLVLGEHMKLHGSPGHEYYLAPVYLCCMIVGMVGLVAVPTVRCPRRSWSNVRQASDPSQGEYCESLQCEQARPSVGETGASGNGVRAGSAGSFALGILFAVFCGVFSAVQFGIVTEGKKIAQRSSGCDIRPESCSDALKEQFDDTGSWFTTFGIGAASVTILLQGGLSASSLLQGKPVPSLQLKTLGVPGSIAGFCWVVGNIFQTLAVIRGGNAVMMPANQALQLLTSGMWGLLYYKEMRDPRRIVCWCFAAAWLVASMILLGQEKQT